MFADIRRLKKDEPATPREETWLRLKTRGHELADCKAGLQARSPNPDPVCSEGPRESDGVQVPTFREKTIMFHVYHPAAFFPRNRDMSGDLSG